VIRAVDLVLAGLLLCVGSVLVLARSAALRGTGRANRTGRRIVYLGTGQIAQVFPRNGVNLFLERECSDFRGYFEQLWNVHFPRGRTGKP